MSEPTTLAEFPDNPKPGETVPDEPKAPEIPADDAPADEPALPVDDVIAPDDVNNPVEEPEKPEKPEDKPHPEPVPEPAKDEPIPEVDDALVRQAVDDLGISAEQAARLAESGELPVVLSAMDKRFAAIGRTQAQETPAAPLPPPEAVPPVATPPVVPMAPVAPVFDLEAAKEEYGDVAAMLLKASHDRGVVQDAAMAKQAEMFNAVMADRTAEKQTAQDTKDAELVEWFDRQRAALGKDWEGTLGKGSFMELDPSGDARKNCVELYVFATSINDGREATGFAPYPRDEAFQRALMALHGAKQTTNAVEAEHKRIRDKGGKYSRKPSQSTSNAEAILGLAESDQTYEETLAKFPD